MKESEKKSKVSFILSCRSDREPSLKQNDTFYQSLFNMYMNEVPNEDINAEFEFYYNQ